MTTGEGLLIAGVAGVGVFAYLKFRQTQSSPVAPPKAPPSDNGSGAAGIAGAQALVTGQYLKAGLIAYDQLAGTAQKRKTTVRALVGVVQAPANAVTGTVTKTVNAIESIF